MKDRVPAFMPADFDVSPTPSLREESSERDQVEQVMYGDNAYPVAPSRRRLAMCIFDGIALDEPAGPMRHAAME